MPSGHAVAGGQHKLSARQPAPLQALLPSFGWPLRDVEPPPTRGPVVFRRPPLSGFRPPSTSHLAARPTCSLAGCVHGAEERGQPSRGGALCEPPRSAPWLMLPTALEQPASVASSPIWRDRSWRSGTTFVWVFLVGGPVQHGCLFRGWLPRIWPTILHSTYLTSDFLSLHLFSGPCFHARTIHLFLSPLCMPFFRSSGADRWFCRHPLLHREASQACCSPPGESSNSEFSLVHFTKIEFGSKTRPPVSNTAHRGAKNQWRISTSY